MIKTQKYWIWAWFMRCLYFWSSNRQNIHIFPFFNFFQYVLDSKIGWLILGCFSVEFGLFNVTTQISRPRCFEINDQNAKILNLSMVYEVLIIMEFKPQKYSYFWWTYIDHIFLNPTVQPRGARAPGLPLVLFPKNAVGAKREKRHLFYKFLLQNTFWWNRGGVQPCPPPRFPQKRLRSGARKTHFIL